MKWTNIRVYISKGINTFPREISLTWKHLSPFSLGTTIKKSFPLREVPIFERFQKLWRQMPDKKLYPFIKWQCKLIQVCLYTVNRISSSIRVRPNQMRHLDFFVWPFSYINQNCSWPHYDFFSERIRLVISCESSEKIIIINQIRMLSAKTLLGILRVNKQVNLRFGIN